MLNEDGNSSSEARTATDWSPRLSRALPEWIRKRPRAWVRQRLRGELPGAAPSLQQFSHYWPHDGAAEAYSRPVSFESSFDPDSPLPVPPEALWANYCTSKEGWLASGRADTDTMRRLLEASGAPIEDARRVVDFGCAAARMLRWFTELAVTREFWGVDAWSTAVTWCQDNMSPPFHFATTTVVPHLPFIDCSFDLIYCGSVFTHIAELAEAWFLELHRILRPGGRLYVTLNDRHAVDLFEGQGSPEAYEEYFDRVGGRQSWDSWVAFCREQPHYQRFRRGDAYMVTMSRSRMTHVMWDAEVLCRRLSYGYELRSLTPAAYGHQSALLLERT